MRTTESISTNWNPQLCLTTSNLNAVNDCKEKMAAFIHQRAVCGPGQGLRIWRSRSSQSWRNCGSKCCCTSLGWASRSPAYMSCHYTRCPIRYTNLQSIKKSLFHSAFQSLHKMSLVGSVDSNYAGKGILGSNHSSWLNWYCTKPHDDMTQKGKSLGTQIGSGDFILWRRVLFQELSFLVNSKMSLFGDVTQMYVDHK